MNVLPPLSEVQAWCTERGTIAGTREDPFANLWAETNSHDCDELDRVFTEAESAIAVLASQAVWTRALVENSDSALATQPWRNLIAEIERLRQLAFAHSSDASSYQPQILIPALDAATADVFAAIAAECVTSKKAPSALSLVFKPAWKKALDHARVAGGAKPTSPEHFTALAAHAELRVARAALARRWNALCGPIEGPLIDDAPTAEGLESRPEAIASKYVALIESAISWRAITWTVVENSLCSVGLAYDELRRQISIRRPDLSELERIELITRDVLPLTLGAERARRRARALDSRFASAIDACSPADEPATAAVRVTTCVPQSGGL